MRNQTFVSSVVCLGITLFSAISPSFAFDGFSETNLGFPTSYFYACQTQPNSGKVYLWHHSRLEKHSVTRQLNVVWERHVEFSKTIEALTEIPSASAESMGGDFNLEIDLTEYSRLVSLNRRSQNYDRLEVSTRPPAEVLRNQGALSLRRTYRAEKPQAYLLAWQGESLKWFRALTDCSRNSVGRSPVGFNEL